MGESDKTIYVTRSSMPPYEEYIEKIRPLWESHFLTNMGIYHQELEKSLQEYLDVNHISLMTNGHMALEMAIQALDMTGEVITTPFTFVSTVHAIKRNNLTPVFCDIREDDFTIDVSKMEKLINKRTCAIVPVHVLGKVCDIEAIEHIAEKYHLHVIYDASHTFGETYKGKHIVSYGEVSTLSFHATKVFNTVEGGAVVYRDSQMGSELYSLKNFGIRSEELIDGVGANAKMDEFRAAMGLCNLKHINDEIKCRRRVYERYMELLSGITGLKLPEIQEHVKSNYAYFPVLFDSDILVVDRNVVYDELRKRGIYARKYFYPLISDTECYKSVYSSKETPVARKVADSILTLPIYADLSMDDVEYICNAVKKIIGRM